MVRNSTFRRFHEQLKKLQVKRMLKSHGNKESREQAENPKCVGIMAHTPHLCSCEMCCNKRRAKLGSIKDRLSIQEKRSNLDLQEIE